MINFFCLEQIDKKVYVYQNLLINMIEKFRKQIIENYAKKKIDKILQ